MFVAGCDCEIVRLAGVGQRYPFVAVSTRSQPHATRSTQLHARHGRLNQQRLRSASYAPDHVLTMDSRIDTEATTEVAAFQTL